MVTAEYTRHVDSGFGRIPTDWDVIKFEQIGEAIIGLTYSPSQINNSGILVLRSSNIQNGQLDYSDQVRVSAHVPEKLILKESDILICVRNGSRALIGKSAIIEGTAIGETFGAFMSVFRTHLSPRLIFQYIQSELIQKQIEKSLGATINQVTNKTLLSFTIPLPPTLEEQKAIVKVLSDTDDLIQSLEKLIEKKKKIKQGMMQELLRPKEGWVEKKLGDVAILKARIGWQGLTTKEYLNSGDYFLVTGTEFESGYINWSNCYYVAKERYIQDPNIQLKENDILVTKDGTIGKVAFVRALRSPATLNSGVFVIRPINNSFAPKFFYFLLLSVVFKDFLAELTAGSTINHLYQKDFVEFKFLMPSSIQEQEKIDKLLSKLDDEILSWTKLINKTINIKKGLMQQLLTGKTRLV